MNYTAQEVLQYAREEDVKFIRLAFCDVFGRPKNISILASELPRAFETGIAIDASAIAGFSDEAHSDLFLHPDPSTLSELPWRSENGKVIRMYCTITDPSGRVFENDVRSLLRQTVADAKAAGVTFAFAAEMEFYLFRLDEAGNPTREPFDHAGYMDVAPDDRCENVRREICLTLEKMGLRPESSHHEEGPGQNEIDFRYADPLTAADHAMTFRTVVKAIAAGNGLYADFSPKPLPGQPGSGMHINISVNGSHNNQQYLIAGILEHICDMTVFLNPTAQSYERLGVQKAPRYLSWSNNNRSQLIRVPAAAGEYRRVELRSPDPMANPYLAFALLIRAGLDGIQKRLLPPEESNVNLFTADHETLSRFAVLPQSLTAAARQAGASGFIRAHLPEALIRCYCG